MLKVQSESYKEQNKIFYISYESTKKIMLYAKKPHLRHFHRLEPHYLFFRVL